jgi:hypothetical protein
MRARAASHAAISLPYVRVRRRVRFWAAAWPRVIGCPGLETVSLFAHARPGCCADVMASRRVGYRPHRLAVRMWTVSGVVPWASGVTNVSIQIVPHRVTGRVVAARSG